MRILSRPHAHLVLAPSFAHFAVQLSFRQDPPGKSVVAAVDLLSKLTLDNPEGLVGFDYRRELKTKDIDIVQQLESVEIMRKKLHEDFVCVNCQQFQSHFDQTAFNCQVRKEFQELRYRLSDDSLQLLPEYDQRLNVLKELRYVDRETGAVQLKGRISCEINNHELMITELILQVNFSLGCLVAIFHFAIEQLPLLIFHQFKFRYLFVFYRYLSECFDATRAKRNRGSYVFHGVPGETLLRTGTQRRPSQRSEKNSITR